MGGNFRCEIDGKVVSGRTIGVSRPGSRAGFAADVKTMLPVLNSLFQEENGSALWPDLSGNIEELLIFGGSTEHVFDPQISDEEFSKYKGSFSDIDIYIPQSQGRGFKLMQTIEKNKGRMLGPKFKIVCTKLHPNESLANTRGTNSIFQYIDGKGDPYVQFDFMPQPIPVEGEEESTASSLKSWVRLSHSSNWRDVQQSVKGVFHKYLLQALVAAASRLDKGHIITPKSPISPPEKVKIAAGSEQDLYSSSFSVEKGLGTTRLTKQDAEYEGAPLYKLTPPSEKKYETDVEKIFMAAFGFEPSKDDLEKMRSFVGILEIMRDNLMQTPSGKKTCGDALKIFIDKLIGDGGQEISTYSASKDIKPKAAAIAVVRSMGFDSLLNEIMPPEEIERTIEKYYGRFQEKMSKRGSLVSDEEELAPVELEENVRLFVRGVLNA